MTPSTVNSERRRNTRKRPPTLIYVELSATNGGMMRDISEEGFALRAMMPLVSGQRTPFSFLLSESQRIEGEGEVVWLEDKGRLAGIHFTELSAMARTEIRNWLGGISDTQEIKEPEEEIIPPLPPQTFEELREELRSAPARNERKEPVKPGKTMWPIPPPSESLAPAADAADELKEPKLPELRIVSPEPDAVSEEPKHPVEPIPFPTLPSFSNNHEGDARFGSRTQAEDRHVPLPPFSKEEVASRPGPPADLPDISQILMQPSRRAASAGSQPPVLEPLVTPPHLREDRGPRGFTLGRAVTIMFVIACVVAAAVYRDKLGIGLIWLGEQIGGTSQTASTATQPQSSETPAAQTPAAAATKPADASPTSTAANVPSAASDSNAQTNPSSGAPPNVEPTIPSNSPPPVTPLSNKPAENSAGAAQTPEAGLTEYSQAMQLLHAKNGVSDPSEAVRLLWISVEKGNASAELTLAELYWRGEGVARNCDQTRILLEAAARKGNNEALKRLQQFNREGCE